MSQQDQTTTIPSLAAPPPVQVPVKDQGVEADAATQPPAKKQRKAYVYTEKRQEAFQKCREARQRSIEEKKKAKEVVSNQ